MRGLGSPGGDHLRMPQRFRHFLLMLFMAAGLSSLAQAVRADMYSYYDGYAYSAAAEDARARAALRDISDAPDQASGMDATGIGSAAVQNLFSTLFGAEDREKTRTSLAAQAIVRDFLAAGASAWMRGDDAGRAAGDTLYAGMHGSMDQFVATLRQSGILGLAALEAEYTFAHDSKPEYALTTVVPVYESIDLRHNVFAQGSFRHSASRETLNLGGGYRYMTADQKWLYGVNSFVDHEWPYDHTRVSLGVDIKTALLGFYANRYWALSGWQQTGVGLEERALDGWDFSVSGRVPAAPELEVFATGYGWDRLEGEKDLRGVRLAAEYTPARVVTLGAAVDKPNDADYNLSMTVRLNLANLGAEDTVRTVPENVLGRRFEKVRRENRIVTQTRSTTGGVVAPFSPADLAGLVAWFDADDVLGNGSVVGDGTPIATWSNKSIAPDATAGGTQPVYRAGVQNGRGGLQANGAYMGVPGNAVMQPITDTMTTFIVLRALGTGNFQTVWSFNECATGPCLAIQQFSTTNDIHLRVDTPGNINQLSSPRPTVLDNTTHILGMTVDTGTRSFFVDGAETALSTYIHGTGFGDNGLMGVLHGIDGYYFETIVYNRVLDAAERAQVEDYLRTKWAL